MQHESQSPLRILVVAPTPFFADRGCHVRIYEQCRTLKEAGHDVTICTYHIGRDPGDLTVRRSLHVPWYRKLAAGPSPHKFYIDLLLLATVLRQCLRRRPDVIHAHLHEGVVIGRIAAAMFRVPMVADLQGSLTGELVQHGFIRDSGVPHRLFLAAERCISRMPRAILASSAATLASLPGLADDPRASVLPDGVDGTTFHPDEEGRQLVRKRLGIDADTPVIGYLGVLTEYQGVSILLQAARTIIRAGGKPPRFLIMGYPDVERYRQQAAKLGIAEHTIFTGRIPYDDARMYLAACDLAVSPKTSETEANGKLLNYLAVGLPVIASDTTINREILRTAGILTPPGDAESLATAIARTLADPGLIEDMKREALERSSQFSWTTLGVRLVDIYREAMGLAPSPIPEPHPIPAQP